MSASEVRSRVNGLFFLFWNDESNEYLIINRNRRYGKPMLMDTVKNVRFYLLGLFLCSHGLSGNERPEAIQYLHPLPGSRYISTQSTLILRFRKTVALRPCDLDVDVSGSRSGVHAGQIRRRSSSHPFIFRPDERFAPDETVTVTLSHESLPEGSFTFQFHTSSIADQTAYQREHPALTRQNAAPVSSGSIPTYGEVTTLNGVTVPSDFPVLEIEGDPDATAPGKLFTGFREQYMVILHNDGTPYFYRRSGDFLMDFKVQPGGLLSRNVDNNRTHEHFFLTMDSQFNTADTFSAGHGYVTDHHEFQLLPNGHALLIARDAQIVDMSEIVDGGVRRATVVGHHIQELDANNEVVWTWLSWDHYDIADAVNEVLTASTIDFTHINSVAVDFDSNLVISSRNQSECAKIDWDTGEFIWRMGGVNNEFAFLHGTDMNSYQHMFRPVPGHPHHYTLFDNGNYHNPRYSRAVEFRVDTSDMTVETVWEYRGDSDFRADWLGSVQRLDNGNTLICWGGENRPFATEVSAAGERLYQAAARPRIASYRTYRFEWQGNAEAPYLLAESDGEQITLIFNKFGDPEVNHYVIYSGSSETELTVLDTTSRTRYDYHDLTSHTDYYFQVTAVNHAGLESPPSEIRQVYITYLGPHGEIIQNGLFRQEDMHWDFSVSGEARADFEIHAGRYVVHIGQPGTEPEQIQVRQSGIPLYHGQTYQFEFDAHATASRTVHAFLRRKDPPYTNYGKIGPTYLLDHRTRHRYTFQMADLSDYEAEVVFHCGGDTADVYLDNVSLQVMTEAKDPPVPDSDPNGFKLQQNYPNPFNRETRIGCILSRAGNVRIQIMNLRGQIIRTTDLPDQPPGNFVHTVSLSGYASGVYLCRIIVFAGDQTAGSSKIFKMLYLQ